MKKKHLVFAATIIVVVAALLLNNTQYLTLTDAETGEVYMKWKADEVSTFEVEFIHSVNLTPVADIYELNDTHIILSATRYRGFGAGVPTQLEGEQKLTYDNEGNMIITGYGMQLQSVNYIVGTVYDHFLTINEEEPINLTELCGKNTHITFRVQSYNFLQ